MQDKWTVAPDTGRDFLSGFWVSRLTADSPEFSIQGGGDVATVMNDLPALVAVNIKADWCRRSPEVAPIFSDLLGSYGSEPILFVTLDITSQETRRQAELLVSDLSIPDVFASPFESGMIKLIDRRKGEVLAILTGEEQVPELEGLLAGALDLLEDR